MLYASPTAKNTSRAAFFQNARGVFEALLRKGALHLVRWLPGAARWKLYRMQETSREVQVSKLKFKDIRHLVRLAIVFVAVFAVFLLIRSHFIPASFGQYGHYRGNALAEVSSRPISYAGHKTCEACHDHIVNMKKAGKHTGVNCESCHGPLARHADDPVSVTPQLPDTAVLCARCHEANIAKPKNFPKVDSAEHSGGIVCKSCHQPHSPLLQPGGNQS